MIKKKKKVIVALIVAVMTLNLTMPVLAADDYVCADWVFTGASTYCSTPICSYADGGLPYLYISKNYTRHCINSHGQTKQEPKSEISTEGCCG